MVISQDPDKSRRTKTSLRNDDAASAALLDSVSSALGVFDRLMGIVDFVATEGRGRGESTPNAASLMSRIFAETGLGSRETSPEDASRFVYSAESAQGTKLVQAQGARLLLAVQGQELQPGRVILETAEARLEEPSGTSRFELFRRTGDDNIFAMNFTAIEQFLTALERFDTKIAPNSISGSFSVEVSKGHTTITASSLSTQIGSRELRFQDLLIRNHSNSRRVQHLGFKAQVYDTKDQSLLAEFDVLTNDLSDSSALEIAVRTGVKDKLPEVPATPVDPSSPLPPLAEDAP